MKNRVDFVDWLKAVGMFLIVFGHFFGEPFDQFTQPIYPKQLGVAFFVFVMGWGLAKETRPQWLVVYNRLFPMYFWGITIALLLSLIFLITQGHPAISNYLPFMAGINVLTNFFPSNPTTWFIGTYLHILLLWAVILRRILITKRLIIFVLVAEWLFRAIWINAEYLMTGYMLISNWFTVLLLGMYMHQQKDNINIKKALYILTFWILMIAVWALSMNYLNFKHTFPFKTLTSVNTSFKTLIVSVCISFVYVSNTLLAVKFFSHIKANAVIRFFSRNTIIVFIGHMPLYAVAEPIARVFVAQGWGKRAIIVFIMYVGLAALSEILHRLFDLNKLKKMLWGRL